MKVVVTAEDLIDRGVWETFCEEKGFNVWAVNEGLMDSSDEFVLCPDDARRYGFIRE
jgi:hypothetical protein